jgi:hypothetical protein
MSTPQVPVKEQINSAYESLYIRSEDLWWKNDIANPETVANQAFKYTGLAYVVYYLSKVWYALNGTHAEINALEASTSKLVDAIGQRYIGDVAAGASEKHKSKNKIDNARIDAALDEFYATFKARCNTLQKTPDQADFAHYVAAAKKIIKNQILKESDKGVALVNLNDKFAAKEAQQFEMKVAKGMMADFTGQDFANDGVNAESFEQFVKSMTRIFPNKTQDVVRTEIMRAQRETLAEQTKGMSPKDKSKAVASYNKKLEKLAKECETSEYRTSLQDKVEEKADKAIEKYKDWEELADKFENGVRVTKGKVTVAKETMQKAEAAMNAAHRKFLNLNSHLVRNLSIKDCLAAPAKAGKGTEAQEDLRTKKEAFETAKKEHAELDKRLTSIARWPNNNPNNARINDGKVFHKGYNKKDTAPAEAARLAASHATFYRRAKVHGMP